MGSDRNDTMYDSRTVPSGTTLYIQFVVGNYSAYEQTGLETEHNERNVLSWLCYAYSSSCFPGMQAGTGRQAR